MAIEIKFICNICSQIYIRTDGLAKIPTGWGAIRPTLRINHLNYGDCDTKKKVKQREKLYSTGADLKKELQALEYHLCFDCLNSAQDKILKIESIKK